MNTMYSLFLAVLTFLIMSMETSQFSRELLFSCCLFKFSVVSLNQSAAVVVVVHVRSSCTKFFIYTRLFASFFLVSAGLVAGVIFARAKMSS
jgi:hypothetical protein